MRTFAHNPSVRFAHKSLAYLLVFCIVNMPVWALDWNGIGTNASFDGNQTVNVTALRSYLEWNNFDTDPGQLLQFLAGGALSADHAVLNKVVGLDPTLFEGILQAGQGHIILFNPNGITIGSTASINAGRFTASTMEMLNVEDFLADASVSAANLQFEFAKAGGDPAAMINITEQVTINAERVELLTQQINNAGTITTGTGGVVVMAAGDSILLGQPGSKVIVEMTGIEGGAVTNAGTITAPEGTIVMAAGDIYSVPLHPQLAGDAVRVETGLGTVEQAGTIDAGSGEVILTAGDTVTLASGSTTSAIDGEVIAYAYDFGDTAATTYFNDGAEIAIGTGLAGINGNHILFAGDVIASPEGTINTYSETLTIADVIPVTGPELDTLYEVMVESYSTQGINLDLSAEEMITVDYMTDDGQILGGSGDIQLRNVFEDGGIIFEEVDGERTSIRTVADKQIGDGGNIYMTAGAGGIIAGDLSTDTLSSDKISNPGRIILLTTNGGNMEVGSMVTERGNISEISAISDGNLTVNGEVVSKNATVSKDSKDVGFARICLVAMENIVIDAESGSIEVDAHAKINATADIIICAGEDVTITNLDSIHAFAQTSENTEVIQLANASIDVSAGGNQLDPATISINGVTYDSTPGADNEDMLASAETQVSGGGSPVRIDTGDTSVAGASGEITWLDEKTDPDPVDDYQLNVKIRFNDNEQVVPGNEGSPCNECPIPPGLPPVPRIFWIMDDFVTVFNKTGINPISSENDMLNNDDNGSPLIDGIVSDYTDDIITANGGTLTPVFDNGVIIGFEYTPPADATYVVDADDPTMAFYTDTFTYKAKDAEGNESLNSATVTIQVKNNVPVANPDTYTEDHNVALDVVDAANGTIQGLEPAFADTDADIGDSLSATLVDDAAFGTVLLNADGTFTYTPDSGNTTGTDSFTYKVTDGFNESNTATVTINLDNADPVAIDNSYGVDHNVELSVNDTDGTITGTLNGVLADYDPDNNNPDKLFDDTLTVTPLAGITTANGGTVTLNADGSFTYTPSASNTSGTDSFEYTLLDNYGGSDTATVTINLDNADPVAIDNSYGVDHNVELSVNDTDGTITGTLNGVLADYDPDNNNPDKLFDDTLTVTPLAGITTANGGTVTLNADGSFTYTPSASNTSGTDSFEYTLLDNYGGSDAATVTITLTNQAPIAQPDTYGTDQDVPLIIVQPDDVITGVIPAINGDYDPDNENEGKVFDDILSAILVGGGTTALGGTVVLNDDGTFTYTPPAGISGTDTFTYYVTDSMDNSEPVLVTILIEGTPPPEPTPTPVPEPLAPIAPLADYEIPKLVGCPAEMEAAAIELAVNSDELQLLIANAMATNPNLQPCDACQNLLEAATALKSINQEQMAALAQIFDTLAPAGAPFTPEVQASVTTAFINFRDMETELATATSEQYEQYQQYVMVEALVEAFVSYVAVLDNDLRLPVGDSMALVLKRYFEPIEDSGNPNIGAYLIEQMQAVQTVTE